MGQIRLHACPAQRQAAYRKRKQEAVEARLAQRGLPPLPVIPSIPAAPRWRAAHQSACTTLSGMAEEMEDYYSERTPRWQDSERGEAFQTRLQEFNELLTALEALDI